MTARTGLALGLFSLAVLMQSVATEAAAEPNMAGAAPGVASVAQDADSAASPGWLLLEKITSLAPARQVGQPGNVAIEAWVEETFQEFTDRNNAVLPDGWASALHAYDLAVEELMENQGRLSLEGVAVLERNWDEADDMESVFKDRFAQILRTPQPIFIVLGAALCMLAVAWWFQRRRELVWAAVGIVLFNAVFAFAAWRVQSAAEERLAVEGPDAQEKLDRSVERFLKVSEALREAGRNRWQAGRLEYHTAAFVPGETSLQTSLGSASLHQLAPNLVDPGNLPSPRLDAPLVYLGTGSFDELLENELDGAIVLLEFNSGNQWLSAVEAGAEAVIFLGPPEGATMNFYQATLKTSNSPISIPRFYLQREDANRLLGDEWDVSTGRITEANLRQESAQWERVPVYADWIHIPGTDSSKAGELVHYQTFKDSASIVPALSPGAESAINLVAVRGLLEEFTEQPPARPVLISVVNDHCNALNGGYVFASFAFTEASALAEEINRIDFLRSRHLLVEHLYGQKPNEALLEYLRGAIERVAGRSFTVKEPIVNHLSMLRNTLRGKENLLRFELESKDLTDVGRKEREAQLAEISVEVEEIIAMLGLFNRFGHQTHWSELTPEQKDALGRVFAELSEKAGREAAALDAERRTIWQNLGFRNRLAADGSFPQKVSSLREVTEAAFPTLPALALFHLDLAAGSDEVGFFHMGAIRPGLNPDRLAGERVRRLSRLTLSLAEELQEESDDTALPRLRDTVLFARGLPPEAHLGVISEFGSRASHQFARPALTLTTVGDQRSVAFTPDDTLEALDPERVDLLLGFVRKFFPRLTSDSRLSETVQTRGSAIPFSVELTVRKMDRFSVEIPRTVLENALLLAFPRAPLETEPIRNLGQVRPFPILMADEFGRQTIRGELWREASLLAFGFDGDFRNVTAALDLGESENRFSSTLTFTPRTYFAHRSIVTFEAEKSDVLGLTEPLTLLPIEIMELLDGRNDTRPRHFSVAGVNAQGVSKRIPLALDGSASVFMQPGLPYKIESGNIIARNTSPDDLRGTGFPISTRLLRNLPMAMAWDYHRLAAFNTELLTSKGVASDAAESFNAEAAIELEVAAASETPGERLLLAEIARGLAFQAYIRTVDTITDLVRAVIILLALVVPFCFFLVKLLSPFTDVNRQILLFMGVFAFFAGVLYFIQPAFHVGDRPEVVILAFVILGLATFVASVIIGRFNASMNQAIEESQLSESTDAPQGRLAGVAFMVGVNNMKRRRIRTTLTCATIVLVTFTILSVISVQQDAEPLRLRVGAEAPYTGLVFTAPGLAPIPDVQLARLRSHFEDRAITVARVWTSRQDQFGSYMPFRIQPSVPRAEARVERLDLSLLLGLETEEAAFLAPLESEEYMLPGSRWFSANDAEEILLSRRLAELLGLSVEDIGNTNLLLNGREYLLVGLFEDAAFEEIRDLRNLPLLPLKVDATQFSGEDAERGTADITQMPGVSVASPMEVALVPIDTARSLGPTTSRVLGIKYLPLEGEDASATATRMWNDAQEFLRFQDAYLGVGLIAPADRGLDRSPLDPGEYSIASGSSAGVAGGLKIIIPVILAATIILNTMLGAVMERKKEISIYNAIGLNPTHVMVFFLAEAMVFGLVGSVAGYFIGQVLSIGIGNFLDINLNYSSLSVMVVIFLTIATVMLSTLYPATLAARAAVPSGQRKWSLPKPEGDEIYLKFPFSYDSRRVLGVCAYLDDFMQQNSEASTGKFLSKRLAVGKVTSEEGQVALCLIYDIAPTPFDLGVNQKMEIYADYDSRVRAHMLSVHLIRKTGEHGSWTTVNQPFLEALRKRLLGWRSQSADTQESYCKSGEALFENSPHLPLMEKSAKITAAHP